MKTRRETPGWTNPLVFLQRRSDVMLALAVTAIVAMMILPLPTALLDLLLTVNLGVAVTLLVVSIYVGDAVRIATFPSLLLVTTLYRLGLNVSSTRLILLQADAGRVIEAFGQFVVQGNFVVGGVVFLILLVIQFVVIAKGSERVAEVAARFTLDALPGKQMAIDADLRAGLVDPKEARHKRRALQRESQFYGAMDGAMKFVKGDAIAGIIITLVNIAAGVAIGVLQRQMSPGEALRLYGLLTIGDGLVSQIPALVISTAAGLVITRVASEEEGAHLGEEITGQILAHPRALAMTAGLLLLLGLVPGLPTVPFLILATLCGFTAWALERARPALGRSTRIDRDFAVDLAGGQGGEPASADAGHLTPPSPISLELGAALASLATAERGASPLAQSMGSLRGLLQQELGVVIPPIRVRREAGLLPEFAYRILLDEIPEAQSLLRPDAVFCPAPVEQLQRLNLVGEPVADPQVFPQACWVPRSQAAAARAAGLATLSPVEVLVAHFDLVLRRRISLFLGVQETQALLDSLEGTHPALVRALIPRVVSLPLLTEVLRRLIEEGVGIRNLKLVLEALLEWAELEKDPVSLTDLVRSNLRRQISCQYAEGGAELPVYLLHPDIEETIRQGVQRSASGTYLALEPGEGRAIVNAIKRVVVPPLGHRHAVILTQPDVRRFVKKLIEFQLPSTAVLSFQELESHLQLRPLGRVAVEEERSS